MYHLSIIRINEFEDMLKEHRFAVTVEDPRELRHALKQESRLQRIALNGDSRYIDLFHRYQQQALNSKVKAATAQNETKVSSHDSIKNLNVNIDYLEFRSKIRNFDWEYNCQQDRPRYNKGKQELTEIRQIAMARGGEFMKFWCEECSKKKLYAFTKSQKANMEARGILAHH